MKKKKLLEDLKRTQIFGTYRGLVYTVEYQKRGLPHIHLLLFLPQKEQFCNAAKVDEIISAEFSLPEDDPDGILMDVVASVMVHGLCGDLNPTAKCMVIDAAIGRKKCCKHFSKPFQEATQVRDDGYPLYRRRNNNAGYDIPHPLYQGQTYWVRNEWVVPHNPFLLQKYHAHINVECCGSVKAVKYIHKYIYKGSDRATAELSGVEKVDEIANHLNGCYIGPAEVMWSLMEFRAHEEYPPVMELQVHLENQQVVVFNADAGPIATQLKLDCSRTTLIAFLTIIVSILTTVTYCIINFQSTTFIMLNMAEFGNHRKKDVHLVACIIATQQLEKNIICDYC